MRTSRACVRGSQRTREGDGTSAGIESEVAEVPIEVAGVEGELESAEVEYPPEVRVVVSCTIPSPSTASRVNMLRTGTPIHPWDLVREVPQMVSLHAEKSNVYFDK